MNILFTGFYFDGWHGSMIHICEIAEYLSSQGHHCYCASVSITDEVIQFAQNNGLELYLPQNLPSDITYDIVWAYHFPILGYLISCKLKYKKIHVGCLSSFVPLEFPPLFYNECSLLSVMSEETKEKLIKNYKIPANKIYVLKNLLPDCFASHTCFPEKILKKIIVVSNHIPPEIKELPQHMPEIQIDFFGSSENTYQKITPEILSQYNVVISIGKTVQYALGMGIPIYNYDYFGGSGYITLQNYKKEEFHNYSGRSFCRKMSAKQIAQELVNNYFGVLSQVPALKEISIKNYLLSTHIDKIMQILQHSPQTNISQSPKNMLFIQYCKFIVEQCSVYLHQIQTLQDNINQNTLAVQNLEKNHLTFQQNADLSIKRIQKYRHKYKKYKKISLTLVFFIICIVLYFATR